MFWRKEHFYFEKLWNVLLFLLCHYWKSPYFSLEVLCLRQLLMHRRLVSGSVKLSSGSLCALLPACPSVLPSSSKESYVVSFLEKKVELSPFVFICGMKQIFIFFQLLVVLASLCVTVTCACCRKCGGWRPLENTVIPTLQPVLGLLVPCSSFL